MKVKDLIKQLQELDPTGEIEVCVGNSDIIDISLFPAYYDGYLQVLKKDLSKECYNIIGLEFRANGQKIVLQDYDIDDYIYDHHGHLDKINITFDHDNPSQWLLDRIEKTKQKAIEFHEKIEELKKKNEKIK